MFRSGQRRFAPAAGAPGEAMYCTHCGKQIGEHSVYCQFCGGRLDAVASFIPPAARRPFARYSSDKKIAGVCGGVARYFGLDSSLVRAIWLLCVLLAGTGLLVYAVLWVAMPLDPDGAALSA
jgi:phage shock protein C